MKKIILAALFSALSLNALAQEAEKAQRQNDVMISPIELIAAPMLNLSYERLVSHSSGIGLNGMFLLNDNDGDAFSQDGVKMQISPYYRQYFGRRYASGFFVEGFVPITTSERSYDGYYYDSMNNSNTVTHQYVPGYSDKKTTVGIGIGLGGKWVTRKNIIFEVSGGLARRFGNLELEHSHQVSSNYIFSYSDDHPRITGKGMLGIGYRF